MVMTGGCFMALFYWQVNGNHLSVGWEAATRSGIYVWFHQSLLCKHYMCILVLHIIICVHMSCIVYWHVIGKQLIYWLCAVLHPMLGLTSSSPMNVVERVIRRRQPRIRARSEAATLGFCLLQRIGSCISPARGEATKNDEKWDYSLDGIENISML